MEILELEKSLFKLEYMSNRDYLNEIIDDSYLELGKSGNFIDKDLVINELVNLKEDRSIDIYNYICNQIDNNTYLVHYITISNNQLFYRTSIWKKQYKYKLLFHQASLIYDKVDLIKF